MIIEIRREAGEPVEVVVTDGADLRTHYEQLTAMVLRLGNWLSSPAAMLLSSAEWEAEFATYQQYLEQLRRLGDELRPLMLKDRYEPLTGDAIVGEVMELFGG